MYMRKENKKQQDQKPLKQKQGKISGSSFPTNPENTSMGAGNQPDNPRGRTKTRDLHTKIAVTGTNNDGQAD